MRLRWVILGILAMAAALWVSAHAHAQQADPAEALKLEWALGSRLRDTLADAIRQVIDDRARLIEQLKAERWVTTHCRDEGCW
jgi:hypothetical protein